VNNIDHDDWIASQLAPITHERRTAALEEAIQYMESAPQADVDVSSAAIAWIQHIGRHEQRFPDDPFVTRDDVLTKLKHVLKQMQLSGHSSWSGSIWDLLA
jgi:hypothetical protein